MPSSRRVAVLWSAAACLLVLVVWAYWKSFEGLAHRWQHDFQYSHGPLVLLFAAVLLWLRRAALAGGDAAPDWRGAALIALGCLLRIGAAAFYSEWVDNISLLPVLAGIALSVGGRTALSWSWIAIAFLFFMIPLPYTVDVGLGGPLRRLATIASTYVMQTCGVAAFSEGNVITVEGAQIGVAEACSGLAMLMTFFAVATAVALVGRRSVAERLVIMASAVPIALGTNITRISVTGLLHATGHEVLAGQFLHDLAGWLMMPCALVVLQCELYYLKHLLLVDDDAPVTVGMNSGFPGTAPPRVDDLATVA